MKRLFNLRSPWLLLCLMIAPGWLAAQVGISYGLQGVGYSHEAGERYYSFDVLARASASGTGIGTGIFYLQYSSAAFGSWIYTGGGLEVIPGTLTTHPFYNYGLYPNDNGANLLAVTFEYEGFAGYGNPLPAEDTQLLRIRLRLEDPLQDVAISFWPPQGDPAWQNLMAGQQYYDDNATLYDPVSAGPGISDSLPLLTQSIQLFEGWNLVSFWLEPLDPDLEAILAGLIGAGLLVKAQDESGNALTEGVGGLWYNGIPAHDPQEGYYLRVNADCLLEAAGFGVNLPLAIDLDPGWNIISYPCQAPQGAMEVLQGLIGAGLLVKAQDESGNALTEGVGGQWYNGIGDFLAGEAYYLNVSQACQLVIADPAKNRHITPEAGSE